MTSTDEERLLELAQAWADAIVANDVRAIGRYMTDDWVIVDQDGIGTREHFLALVASGELTHEMMRTVDGTARVRVHGDTAVLTARVVNTAHYRGQAFHADEWTTDVYLRTPAGWLCTHSHVTPAA